MQLGRSQPFYLKSNFDAKIFDSQDCIELIPKESICSIVTSECVVVENDLRWRNGQNKSCRSQKGLRTIISKINFRIFESNHKMKIYSN